MTVTSTIATTAANAATTVAAAANPYAKMGATDFLKLLTTQMKNQDPTQPVDNTQMVADMAQFTNVANTSTMNTTLSTISAKLDALTAAVTAKTTTGA